MFGYLLGAGLMIAAGIVEIVLGGRSKLGRLVGCRYWGPGRYGAALRAAVRDGRIRRVGRGMYGPAD